MDHARWHRIQSIFHDAADLPLDKKRAFVEAACGDDKELSVEVLAMLDQDASGHSLLDRNIVDLAHETLAKSVPASLIFKEIGPYRILRLLGEGGMGVVYLAERSDLGTQVAVKVLRDAWLSPARRERFGTEQRTLAQLNHPSIARLYDADVLDDGTIAESLTPRLSSDFSFFGRYVRQCSTRTATQSSTVILSRLTSSSRRTARSACSISASPNNWRVWTCKWIKR